MRYFGEPGDAPVYEEIEQAATPVGRRCVSCHDPIEPEDRGYLIPYLPSLETDGGGGSAVIGEEPWHRGCFLRNVLGPLADISERPADRST